MQIVLHAGAHFTEEDRIIRCLQRNADDFAPRGISIPEPARYRKLLRETFSALDGSAPAPGARDVLLDAILDTEISGRVVLSHVHLFGAPRAGIRAGRLYPNAAGRTQQIAQIFPHGAVELFIAIRNPATFLPAVYAHTPQSDLIMLMGNARPHDIRWSDTLAEIRRAAPNVSITVWCHEDTPLLWAQIIRELAGLEHGTKIIGGFDLLSDIMAPESMKRFRKYLKAHPVMTEIQKRRVISAFLDKFAMEDALEEELDMPGWTETLIDEMTDIYDEDVDLIQSMPGLTLIAP